MNDLNNAAGQIGGDLQELAHSLLDDVMQIVQSLPPEALNWTPPSMKNSPYTIAYHLLGSARYWIGEVVGGLLTDRVRSEEFDQQGSLDELEARAGDVRLRFDRTLGDLKAEDLLRHPIDLGRGVLSWGTMPPEGRTSIWVLTHDLCHIAYHLGQLDRIKRIWNATHQPTEQANS